MFPLPSKRFFLISILVLATLITFDLSKKWGFPAAHFPIEKGEKVKISESGVEQTFLASRNHLSGISVLFGGSNIKNGGILSFALFDKQCKTILREKSAFLTTLDSDNTTDFFFKPIPISAGEVFCFRIDFTPKEGSKKASVFKIPNTLPSEKLSFSINGESIPGESASFRPIYRNENFFSDLIELNHRISQYKPWFLKDAFLALIAALSVGLSFGFLLSIVFREDKNTFEEIREDR